MHSNSDNIEVMINDEADEVIKYRFENRRQNNLESMKVSEFVFFVIYCIINVIKEIRIMVNHI